ncbi:g4992 [Coccomyxa elongata]
MCLVTAIVDSDSDSDRGLDTDEEEMMKLGDGTWVHENYLAYLREPKDVEIILFCRGDPGTWMAVAPEWQIALGFGTTIEEASDDLQSNLVATKLLFIDEKLVDQIKRIPMDFKANRARRIREGWWDGFYDEREKAYFDKREKDASAVEWRTIQV